MHLFLLFSLYQILLIQLFLCHVFLEIIPYDYEKYTKMYILTFSVYSRKRIDYYFLKTRQGNDWMADIWYAAKFLIQSPIYFCYFLQCYTPPVGTSVGWKSLSYKDFLYFFSPKSFFIIVWLFVTYNLLTSKMVRLKYVGKTIVSTCWYRFFKKLKKWCLFMSLARFENQLKTHSRTWPKSSGNANEIICLANLHTHTAIEYSWCLENYDIIRLMGTVFPIWNKLKN